MHEEKNNEIILMIKDLKNLEHLWSWKCIWNKNQNKDVISEEFMVYEEIVNMESI